MTTPANLPNQVGIQGTHPQLALWIARAANAVNWLLQTKASAFSSLNNYSVTATSQVAVGMGISITPISTGRVLVIASGVIGANSGTVNFDYALRYGTGTAAAQGGAIGGTIIGQAQTPTNPIFSSIGFPGFALNGLVFLNPGTSYWFDIGINVGASQTGQITEINMTAVEL